MGKLIKNHWARLIILTAAACMSSIYLHPSNPHPHRQRTKNRKRRPNRRLNQWILLAETLLGLPNHEPRPRRPTHPHPPDPQPAPRPAGPVLGMALTALHHRRHVYPLTQQPRRHLLQPRIPKALHHHHRILTQRCRPPEQAHHSPSRHAPQHRSPPAHLPLKQSSVPTAIPRYQRRDILHHRHGRLLLGLQRRGSRHGRAVDVAPAAKERGGDVGGLIGEGNA